jgi:hypothetical protein
MGPGTKKRETCEAGVRYDDVTLLKGQSKGLLDSLPCFSSEPSIANTLCDKRRFPTDEEVAEEERQSRESLKQYFDKIEQGICPHCDQPMTQKEVRPCVYASPCGHRLFQGTIAR